MEKYINHVEKSFQDAENLISKINSDIINMEGMTGTKTRHFYNNLLNIDDARYLEIGTWKGSSVCSAMFDNKAKVVCMDNWAQFGGPKSEFLSNFNKFKGDNDAAYIEHDCFSFDLSKLDTKFNIYLFDGEHSSDSQQKALEYYLPVLDDVFIFIVDDWNWESVQTGTNNAISNLSLEVLYKKEIKLNEDGRHTHETANGDTIARDTWWNGIVAYVLKK
jgi:hypothetical protein